MRRFRGPASRVVGDTGASGAIGLATALESARRGDGDVRLTRGEARLEAASKEVRDLGVDALLAPIDVTCPDQAEAAMEKIKRDSRPVDVWVPVASSSPHLEYLYDLVRLLSARALPPRDGLLALHGTPGKAAAFTSASAAPFAVRS